MIAEVIGLDSIWLLVMLLTGAVLHFWLKVDGPRKVAVYGISALVAAVICSYPILL